MARKNNADQEIQENQESPVCRVEVTRKTYVGKHGFFLPGRSYEVPAAIARALRVSGNLKVDEAVPSPTPAE